MENNGHFEVSISRNEIELRDDMKCMWSLTVGRDRLIRLTIANTGTNCTQEYIDIHDGPDQTSPRMIPKYEADMEKKVLTSSGRYVLVRLVPNHDGTSCGFTVKFDNIGDKGV